MFEQDRFHICVHLFRISVDIRHISQLSFTTSCIVIAFYFVMTESLSLSRLTDALTATDTSPVEICNQFTFTPWLIDPFLREIVAFWTLVSRVSQSCCWTLIEFTHSINIKLISQLNTNFISIERSINYWLLIKQHYVIFYKKKCEVLCYLGAAKPKRGISAWSH